MQFLNIFKISLRLRKIHKVYNSLNNNNLPIRNDELRAGWTAANLPMARLLRTTLIITDY